MHTSMPLGGTLKQEMNTGFVMMGWAYGMVAVYLPESSCDNSMTILYYHHIICFLLCLFILLMPDVSLGYQGMYNTFLFLLESSLPT
jgi:hypothetical protein